MDTYLVSYDICDPKRLRRVAKVCEDFGFRRQFSVFLCRLSATNLVRLRSRLYDIVDLKADRVLIIRLCAGCAAGVESLGHSLEGDHAHDAVMVV